LYRIGVVVGFWRGGEEMRGVRRQQVMRQAVVALLVTVMSVVVPLGSRRAALNHHATSGLEVAGADLSRAVVILPALKVNVTSLNGMCRAIIRCCGGAF
jgi:hypothetical protein